MLLNTAWSQIDRTYKFKLRTEWYVIQYILRIASEHLGE